MIESLELERPNKTRERLPNGYRTTEFQRVIITAASKKPTELPDEWNGINIAQFKQYASRSEKIGEASYRHTFVIIGNVFTVITD